MRYLRYVLLGTISVVILTAAIANRDMVTIYLIPQGLEPLLGFSSSLRVPMFIVILATIVIGIFIGFIWEWLREMKLRSAASAEHRQVLRMQHEIDTLKSQQNNDKDDVLALLDDAK